MSTTVTPPEAPFRRELTAAERRPLTAAERKLLGPQESSGRPTAASVDGEDESSSGERQAILADQVALLVARGRRLQYKGHFDAVLVREHRPGYGLDRLPRFLTGFLRGERRECVAVDNFANVTIRDQ